MDAKKMLLVSFGVGAVIWVLAKSKGNDSVVITQTEARVLSFAPELWDAGYSFTIEPAIMAAIMDRESKGRADAKGADGEIGLMQMLPGTIEWMCPLLAGSIRQPSSNISCAAQYLQYCMSQEQAVVGMIAAYNAGTGAVYPVQGGFKMPKSTAGYVADVLQKAARYRSLFRLLPEYADYYNIYFPSASWPLSLGKIWYD